jgi:hypothetical protein
VCEFVGEVQDGEVGAAVIKQGEDRAPGSSPRPSKLAAGRTLGLRAAAPAPPRTRRRQWRARQPAQPAGHLRLYYALFAEVAAAAAALLDHGVVHFDLKCDNCLLEPLPGGCAGGNGPGRGGGGGHGRWLVAAAQGQQPAQGGRQAVARLSAAAQWRKRQAPALAPMHCSSLSACARVCACARVWSCRRERG